MRARNLPITGPCPVELDRGGPSGEGKRRFCEHCDKNVHVLSNMREVEARAFLKAHAGEKLCLSYRLDGEGRIQFRSDRAPELPERGANLVPLGALRRRAPRRERPARTAPVRTAPLPRVAAALLLGSLMSACAPHESPQEREEMGKVEVIEHEVRGDFAVPPEEMLAGAVAIPEEMEEGKVEIPEEVEPRVKLEDETSGKPEGDTPCDPPTPPRRGAMAVPVMGEAPIEPPPAPEAAG